MKIKIRLLHVIIFLFLSACSGEEAFQKESKAGLETILAEINNLRTELVRERVDYDARYRSATNSDNCRQSPLSPEWDSCFANQMKKADIVMKEHDEAVAKLRDDAQKIRERFLALEDRIKKRYRGALPDWVKDDRNWRALDKEYQR